VNDKEQVVGTGLHDSRAEGHADCQLENLPIASLFNCRLSPYRRHLPLESHAAQDQQWSGFVMLVSGLPLQLAGVWMLTIGE